MKTLGLRYIHYNFLQTIRIFIKYNSFFIQKNISR